MEKGTVNKEPMRNLSMVEINDTAAWVTGLVRGFVREGAENRLWDGADERAWGEPLVGFSRGDDPLYAQYKEVVGPFHWTPWEIFSRTFPDTDER